MKLPAFFLATLLLMPSAFAETPAQLLAAYTGEAAKTQPGFTPSVERGRHFYLEQRKVTEQMVNCAVCHGDDPRQPGKHIVTGKTIDALAPINGSKRFTDQAKSDKWFSRNCKEVVGRECTPAEKADMLRFLITKSGT